jgi:hypothetical protein
MEKRAGDAEFEAGKQTSRLNVLKKIRAKPGRTNRNSTYVDNEISHTDDKLRAANRKAKARKGRYSIAAKLAEEVDLQEVKSIRKQVTDAITGTKRRQAKRLINKTTTKMRSSQYKANMDMEDMKYYDKASRSDEARSKGPAYKKNVEQLRDNHMRDMVKNSGSETNAQLRLDRIRKLTGRNK